MSIKGRIKRGFLKAHGVTIRGNIQRIASKGVTAGLAKRFVSGIRLKK
jgi:hypothetical protein